MSKWINLEFREQMESGDTSLGFTSIYIVIETRYSFSSLETGTLFCLLMYPRLMEKCWPIGDTQYILVEWMNEWMGGLSRESMWYGKRNRSRMKPWRMTTFTDWVELTEKQQRNIQRQEENQSNLRYMKPGEKSASRRKRSLSPGVNGMQQQV